MQPRKLDFIDALRGLAALYVALYHFSLITSPAAVAPRWLAPVTGLGGSGVTLFFVVSAFTLCLSMEARGRDESTPISNYFLRRFFRIAPLFYVWIVLYLVRDPIIFKATHSFAEIARSAFFLLNLFPGQEQGFVWASWTLGVEMLFYVLFPAIFRAVDSIGKAGAYFLATILLRSAWHALVPRLVDDPAVASTYYNFSLLYHLPTFLVGILAYHVHRAVDLEAARRLGIGHLLIAIFCWAMLSLCYGLLQTGPFDGITVLAILYGILLIGLSILPAPVFVNRVTRFFGKISYSVYLSHAATLALLSKAFAPIYARSPYVTIAYLVSVGIGLSVVTLISYVTYRTVELPGQNMARRIIRRSREPLAAPGAL
jgi:peptidoglycan/LPS O-acetylase OafA/YrhL